MDVCVDFVCAKSMGVWMYVDRLICEYVCMRSRLGEVIEERTVNVCMYG